MRKPWKLDVDAVLIYLASPTRLVLVTDESYETPYRKLPGGSIEEKDQDTVEAAMRELREETGIVLTRGMLRLHALKTLASGAYQYFYVARVPEEKLDTRRSIGDESGSPLNVEVFALGDVLSLPDLLPQHREFIRRQIEG